MNPPTLGFVSDSSRFVLVFCVQILFNSYVMFFADYPQAFLVLFLHCAFLKRLSSLSSFFHSFVVHPSMTSFISISIPFVRTCPLPPSLGQVGHPGGGAAADRRPRAPVPDDHPKHLRNTGDDGAGNRLFLVSNPKIVRGAASAATPLRSPTSPPPPRRRLPPPKTRNHC